MKRLHMALPYDHGAYEASTDDVAYAISELVGTLELAVECGLQDLRLEHKFEEYDLVSLLECYYH